MLRHRRTFKLKRERHSENLCESCNGSAIYWGVGWDWTSNGEDQRVAGIPGVLTGKALHFEDIRSGGKDSNAED